MKYTFILPIYNEALILRQSVELLLDFLKNKWAHSGADWQIVLADNGSTDSTEQVCSELRSENLHEIKYLKTTIPGRGQALRSVAEKFDSEIYCYMDIDLPIILQEVPRMLAPIESGTADIAVGKRAGKRPLLRRLLTVALGKINFLLFGFDFQDAQSGIKTWNKKASNLMRSCKESGFFLDTEFVAMAKKQNYTITEVPVDWIERRYERRVSSVKPLRDSFRALNALHRIANVLYPKLNNNLFTFSAIGLGLFLMSIFSLFYIKQPGGEIALDIERTHNTIAAWAIMSMVLYASLWLWLVKTKNGPWKIFAGLGIIFFLFTSGSAAISLPTQSQDLYWNLSLTRNWVETKENPYQTTINNVSQSNWTSPITKWKALPMTHGPAWVLLLALFIKLNFSLYATIVSIKILFVSLTLASALLWWKIMTIHGWTLEKKTKLFLLGILSPFILQAVLVDGHNDVLILFGITLSYYFFLTRKFSVSTIILLIAGFIKYIPWLLAIIPYTERMIEARSWDEKIKVTIFYLLIFIGLGFVLYAPFGLPWQNASGLGQKLVADKHNLFQLPGTYLISLLPFVNNIILRIASIFVGVLLIGYFVYKRKFVHSWILPYVVILGFTTPWFMPWYALWIYPLLGIFVSLNIFAILNLSLFIMQINAPLIASLIGLLGVIFYFTFKLFLQKINKPAQSKNRLS